MSSGDITSPKTEKSGIYVSTVTIFVLNCPTCGWNTGEHSVDCDEPLRALLSEGSPE